MFSSGQDFNRNKPGINEFAICCEYKTDRADGGTGGI